MKVIVAGSRSVSSLESVARACRWAQEEGFRFSQIVSGTCRGPDLLGEQLALKHNIPIMRFPADWARLGRSAGYRRNEQMAAYADALVAVWDGHSRGTAHMIDIARSRGLRVFVCLP